MSGSSLLAEIEAAQNIELNFSEMIRAGQAEADNIRYQGEMTAYKSLLGGMEYSAQAQSYSQQASNAATANMFKQVQLCSTAPAKRRPCYFAL